MHPLVSNDPLIRSERRETALLPGRLGDLINVPQLGVLVKFEAKRQSIIQRRCFVQDDRSLLKGLFIARSALGRPTDIWMALLVEVEHDIGSPISSDGLVGQPCYIFQFWGRLQPVGTCC